MTGSWPRIKINGQEGVLHLWCGDQLGAALQRRQKRGLGSHLLTYGGGAWFVFMGVPKGVGWGARSGGEEFVCIRQRYW
jgi:hypothetical protein